MSKVIHAITEGKSHVPFRDNPLTMILQPYIGGNSQTTLILSVSNQKMHLWETLRTLRFGHVAKNIKNKATVNKKITFEDLVTKLNEYEDIIRSKDERIK